MWRESNEDGDSLLSHADALACGAKVSGPVGGVSCVGFHCLVAYSPSAGLAPFKVLSAISAARRNTSYAHGRRAENQSHGGCY